MTSTRERRQDGAVERSLNWAHGVSARGGFVYVNGVQVVDARTPETPRQVAVLRTQGRSRDSVLDGSTLFVAKYAEGGVRFIDVSAPEQPTERLALTALERAEDVAVGDGFLYVAGYDAGLWTVHLGGDLPPPATPAPTPTAISRSGLRMRVFVPLAARAPIAGRCR